MGMSYEEFWEKDHLLVESYVKKQNLDVERETAWSWEIAGYIRQIEHEVAVMVNADKKDKDKAKDIFPDKPKQRSVLGLMNEKRDELIAQEINYQIQEKINNLNNKRGESNGDN